jgi:hypothetical protein
MRDQFEGPILALAEVVADLAHQHLELLGFLKELQADLLHAPAPLDSGQPRSPGAPLAARPPTGTTVASSHGATSAGPGIAPRSTPPGIAPLPPITLHESEPAPDQGMAMSTKRRYDYFTELDDLLMRLPAASEHEIPSASTDQ